MDQALDIEHALHTLRNGGTILYPTDTIWGLGCDATDPRAVKEIFRIKQRPDSKSLIVLVADQKDLLQYVSNPDPRVFDFLAGVQKPTTVIYDGVVGLAENLSADGTLGIRVVQDPFCKTLIKRLRKPLVSTSANISGQPAPRFFDEIDPQIVEAAGYTVQFRREDRSIHEPSSIVRFGKNGAPEILRP